MTIKYEGGCLCGAIRYAASKPPSRTVACHCTFCQRFTGSAYNIEVIFEKEAVELKGDDLRTFDKRSEGSGKTVHVHFCRRCGTTVSLTFERFPTHRAIMRGTLDDPNSVKVDRHIFTQSAQNGMVLPAGIECFEQHPFALDGTPREATKFDAPHEISR